MSDILFEENDYMFSYRVAGICVQNGKVLIHKPANEDSFAFPGGHVAYGETNEETLIREFREEIGADISVNNLKWVQENFFPWGEKKCHQICLYYIVTINGGNIPTDGVFTGREKLRSRGSSELEFYWKSIDELANIRMFPINAHQLLTEFDVGVHHFVSKE